MSEVEHDESVANNLSTEQKEQSAELHTTIVTNPNATLEDRERSQQALDILARDSGNPKGLFGRVLRRVLALGPSGKSFSQREREAQQKK